MKKYLVPAAFTLLIVAVLFFAIRALVSPSNDATSADTASPTPQAITDKQKEQLNEGQKIGNEKASVVITNFGDLQCPACKSYEPTLQEIRNTYKDKMVMVFKHFPLHPQPHKNARVSAYAAEAAS